MKRRFLTYSLAILLALPAWSQFAFPTLSGRGAGMGGCATAIENQCVVNVAGWAWQERATLTLAACNTALLKELSHAEVAAGLPTRHSGAFALSFNHFGTAVYHERRTSLAYAMPLGRIALGARFDYLHSGTQDAHYQPVNQLSFAAGLMARPTDRCTLGLRTEGGHLWNLGAAYQLRDELIGTAEVEYDRLLRLRAGVEYQWQQTLYARMGVASNPALYTVGIGYRHRYAEVDLALQVMSHLGNTMNLSLTYRP